MIHGCCVCVTTTRIRPKATWTKQRPTPFVQNPVPFCAQASDKVAMGQDARCVAVSFGWDVVQFRHWRRVLRCAFLHDWISRFVLTRDETPVYPTRVAEQLGDVARARLLYTWLGISVATSARARSRPTSTSTKQPIGRAIPSARSAPAPGTTATVRLHSAVNVESGGVSGMAESVHDRRGKITHCLERVI